MVKKRCDFCLKIKQANLGADQKVLNKDIKDVLMNLAGVEVSSEQLSNILTCFDCAIGILQAEPMAMRVRALLMRLSKQKIRKRPGAVNGDVSGATLVDDELQETQDGDKKPVAKRVVGRRKSVAKKVADIARNDDLDGSLAANSTLVVNTSITVEKSAPTKKSKALRNVENAKVSTPSPKKPVMPNTPQKSQEDMSRTVEQQKPAKRSFSEMSDNLSQSDDTPAVQANTAKIAKKIAVPRKSVVKKFSESILNDGLEGSPAASSTMAVIYDKSTPMRTPKKDNKSIALNKLEEGILSSKKTAKRKISENNSQGEDNEHIVHKSAKLSFSEKTAHNSQDDHIGHKSAKLSFSEKSPLKSEEDHIGHKSTKLSFSEKSEPNSQEDIDETIEPSDNMDSTKVSRKKASQRKNSDRSTHNSQDETGEILKPFKKMKDPDADKMLESLDVGSERLTRECLECGKAFHHQERYEAHVFAQKCKLATYACDHPSCFRRFFKLQKMLEHVQKKHPELQDAGTD